MVVKKKKSAVQLLHLVCKHCGHRFTSKRYRKYCTTKCQLEVNAIKSQGRYQQLRKAYLKAQGEIN